MTIIPQWAAQGFEIAGFVWWQGFNDQSEPAASRHETNLTNIIHHLRAYYSARYPGQISPNAPFVLATIGFGGWSLFQELLDTLGKIGAKHSTPIASVAARWVLEREAVASVMIGTRGDTYIDDTLQIFGFRLDTEDKRRISSIVDRATGPFGQPFELEREPDGPHAKIMWTDLNRQRDSGSSV